jgi:ERCC4-type nuclease
MTTFPRDPDGHYLAPFTVVIDSREQQPYRFDSIRGDHRVNWQRLVVPTVRQTLMTGDYSIVGLESAIAIERKSTPDFLACCGRERERFERELERLGKLQYGAVVVEDELGSIESGLTDGWYRSHIRPASIVASVIAWSQRYGVAFWFCHGRERAETFVFDILERFHRDVAEGKRPTRSE